MLVDRVTVATAGRAGMKPVRDAGVVRL